MWMGLSWFRPCWQKDKRVFKTARLRHRIGNGSAHGNGKGERRSAGGGRGMENNIISNECLLTRVSGGIQENSRSKWPEMKSDFSDHPNHAFPSYRQKGGRRGQPEGDNVASSLGGS